VSFVIFVLRSDFLIEHDKRARITSR